MEQRTRSGGSVNAAHKQVPGHTSDIPAIARTRTCRAKASLRTSNCTAPRPIVTATVFGRGKQEEEDSGLGSLSSGAGLSPGGAEPLTRGLPAGYSSSSPAHQRRPPSERPSETPLLIVFMVLALVAVGGLLVKLENDDAGKKVASGSAGAVSVAAGAKLVTDKNSYLQPTRLAAELRDIDRRVGGTARIVDLRLAGDSFSASYANRDDNRVTLTKTSSFTSRSTIPIAVTSVVPSSQIDPQVPLRLVNAVHERTGARPQDIDYLVFSAAFAKLGSAWSIFLNKGPASQRQFVADVNGHHLRRPGER